MREWIRNIIGKFKDSSGTEPERKTYDQGLSVENYPCVETITGEGIRVRVLEVRRDCGHHRYLFSVDVAYPGTENWTQVATIADPGPFRCLGVVREAENYVYKIRWLMNYELVFADED